MEQNAKNSWLNLIFALQRESVVLIAKVDKAHHLTTGRSYPLALQNGIPFFTDDLSIPTALTLIKYIEHFEPALLRAVPTEAQARSVEAIKYKADIADLVAGLSKHNIPEGGFKPGDVVIDYSLHEAYQLPMIVMRTLSREEQLKAAQFAQTIAARQVLVFYRREDDSYGAGIYSAEALTKVGSLEEWGLPPLDPKLIPSYTIFD